MRTEVSVTSIGMDVHYKFSTVSFRDTNGRVVRRERLDHADRPGLIAQIRRWPKGAVVVMEASFGWGWLSDLLVEEGFEVYLSNCYKVEQMRKAHGQVKTNKKDADLLSLLPAEQKPWWRVWRAPREVRDRREWTRLRMTLVRTQTLTKNRIHAIFHRHGIFHEFADLFGTQGRQFLIRLCREGSPYLPPGAWMTLQTQVRLLDHLRGQLATVTRRLRTALKDNPELAWVKTIPGCGPVLSHVIYAEIGDRSRFAGAASLAAYSLLAPLARDSGEPTDAAPLGRRLGQRGNRTLKWAFIEAARGAVRKGGEFRAYFDRHTAGGRQNRNRGYIKVARRLVDLVYAVWRDQREYRPAPARSVRQPRRTPGQAPRSGRGRLNRPMVTG